MEDGYDTLVIVLTGKGRLELIAAENRTFNRDVLEITRGMKQVFESPKKVEDVTL